MIIGYCYFTPIWSEMVMSIGLSHVPNAAVAMNKSAAITSLNFDLAAPFFQAANTYMLALDGDVDFKPDAVRLLVDLLKKNKKVGAACGRIHPIGSGTFFLKLCFYLFSNFVFTFPEIMFLLFLKSCFYVFSKSCFYFFSNYVFTFYQNYVFPFSQIKFLPIKEVLTMFLLLD